MKLKETDLHWMLVHSTSSLPYIAVACYLLWIHIKAIRQGTKRAGPALVTALLVTLVTVGGLLFNQPPFRFMVSESLNAVVKDLVVVVQACLLTILADQLSDITAARSWAMRAALGLIPIAHTSWWYARQLAITQEMFAVVREPWTLTLYALLAYGYSWASFYRQQKRTRSPQMKWRLQTLLWGLTFIMAYIVGRGTMELVPPHLRDGAVWVNRLGLTLGTVFITLGLSNPGWYMQFGTTLNVIQRAGRHLDNLVGLLGLMSDREISLKNAYSETLSSTAAWLATTAGYDPHSVSVAERVAKLLPARNAGPLPYVPKPDPVVSRPVDVAHSIILNSEVYEVLVEILAPAERKLSPEAEAIFAAQLYLDGQTDDEIRAVCSPSLADAVYLLRIRAPSH